MKKVSKVISIFMAAVFALSVFAVSVSAVATPLTAGSTKEKATNIPSFGTEYTSELSKAGETDWFKFTTLSEDAYYTISLENYNIAEGSYDTSSLNLFVYDINNKQLVYIYRTSSANIKLEKNTTYYAKVAMGSNKTSSTGNYEILISYNLDPVSNFKEEATTINVNNTYKYSLDGTGDADWFKFTVPVNDTYKVSLENYNIAEGSYDTSSLNLFIYDIYNKQLVYIYRTSSTNIKLEKNTTYYIKVAMGNGRSNSIGNYSFSVSCGSVPSTPTAKTLSKITIDSLPSKTTYAIGESFDKAGLAVTAHYSDGTKAAVTSCTVYGFDSSTTGTKELTISYTENGVTKTATFNVTVTEDGAAAPDTGFDFMAILTAIWDFFVSIFNFILGLFM